MSFAVYRNNNLKQPRVRVPAVAQALTSAVNIAAWSCARGAGVRPSSATRLAANAPSAREIGAADGVLLEAGRNALTAR
jgi:hypothetical protein